MKIPSPFSNFISGCVWLRETIEGRGGRPQQHFHFKLVFLLTGVSGVCVVGFQTEEMLPDDKLKPLIKFPISNES